MEGTLLTRRGTLQSGADGPVEEMVPVFLSLKGYKLYLFPQGVGVAFFVFSLLSILACPLSLPLPLSLSLCFPLFLSLCVLLSLSLSLSFLLSV